MHRAWVEGKMFTGGYDDAKTAVQARQDSIFCGESIWDAAARLIDSVQPGTDGFHVCSWGAVGSARGPVKTQPLHMHVLHQLWTLQPQSGGVCV